MYSLNFFKEILVFLIIGISALLMIVWVDEIDEVEIMLFLGCTGWSSLLAPHIFLFVNTTPDEVFWSFWICLWLYS